MRKMMKKRRKKTIILARLYVPDTVWRSRRHIGSSLVTWTPMLSCPLNEFLSEINPPRLVRTHLQCVCTLLWTYIYWNSIWFFLFSITYTLPFSPLHLLPFSPVFTYILMFLFYFFLLKCRPSWSLPRLRILETTT